MTRAVFDTLVAEYAARPLPDPTPRDVAIPALPHKADALVGMRRVGKTWRMFQHLRAQLAGGVPRSRTLYVNFEDERITPAAEGLSHLVEAWEARFPDAATGPRWLYLDEVQAVPGWERFVRRLLDDGLTRVVLTGSSSRLLSTEIATSLRGRALPTEVLPFSLREAIVHAGGVLPDAWPPPPPVRAQLEAAWSRYAESGGFPEVQGLDAALRRRVLQDYVDVVILRDVVERHGVTQVAALRWLSRRLLAHPAGRFTANKLYRDLKAQGLGAGKDTVHALIGHLEDAHLLHALPLYTASLARRSSNPRKAYPVDPALSRTATFGTSDDVGHRLETFVYLDLRRRGFVDLGYVVTADGFEVDFCGIAPDGSRHLVQVCATMEDPTTRAREVRAMDAALRELGADHATFVTAHASGREVVAGREVPIVPAWAWLLRGG